MGEIYLSGTTNMPILQYVNSSNSLYVNGWNYLNASCGDITTINGATGLTVESWIKTRNDIFAPQLNDGYYFNKYNIGGYGINLIVTFLLYTGTTGAPQYDPPALEARFWDSGTAYRWRNNYSGITFTNWNHYAYTFDTTNSIMKWIINGVEVFSGSTTISGKTFTSIPSNTGDVRLGGGYNNILGLNGYMDEIRIWDHPRTIGEINLYKDVRITGNENGLIAYYNLDNVSGSTIYDSSINSWDATVASPEVMIAPNTSYYRNPYSNILFK